MKGFGPVFHGWFGPCRVGILGRVVRGTGTWIGPGRRVFAIFCRAYLVARWLRRLLLSLFQSR
jgi:hypothetical protein